VSGPNLSGPWATLAHTLPRLRSSNTCSAVTLLPTGGPVHTWPRVEPDDELPPCGGLPTGPFQWGEPFNPDDLRPDPADAAIYDTTAAILAELQGLGEQRKKWRRRRLWITYLWVMASGCLVLAFALAPWWGIGAFGLAIYAIDYDLEHDASARRGRELEKDIAAATGRLRELQAGGGS